MNYIYRTAHFASVLSLFIQSVLTLFVSLKMGLIGLWGAVLAIFLCIPIYINYPRFYLYNAKILKITYKRMALYSLVEYIFLVLVHILFYYLFDYKREIVLVYILIYALIAFAYLIEVMVSDTIYSFKYLLVSEFEEEYKDVFDFEDDK